MTRKKIMDSRTTELHYWAGFIDGEGSLKLYIRPKKNSRGKIYDCYVPRLEVTNTDIDVIEQMKNFFNRGHIYKDKIRTTEIGNTCKPIARWTVSYQDLYHVLKEINNCFKCKAKKNVSEQIIHYYETRKGKPQIKYEME